MTSNNGQWTRDDLPSVMDLVKASVVATAIDPSGGADAALDAVVAHLNAHHPKPEPYDQGGVRGADSLLYRAERERDAAVARADALDKQLAKVMSDYQDIEDERDEWKARAEAAEARTAPAVTRDDIENAIRTAFNQRGGGYTIWHVEVPAAGVCDLLGIGSEAVVDPAVLVVRESDLPAARVDGDHYVVASAKGDYKWPQHGPSWWAGRAQDALAKAARYTALARLAAREATVNPAEAKARVEADRRYSGDPNHAFIEGAVWAARHVLEREASSHE